MKRLFKGKIFFMLAASTMLTISAMAQSGNFKGKWVNEKDKPTADENTSGMMTIEDKNTTWNIFNNQLFFDLTNRMKGDTLLLIYKSCDCSNPYRKSTIKFPKSGAVIAKCYHMPNNELGMIYTNKKLVSSVMDYVHGSMTNAEKKTIFPEKMYPAQK